MKKYLLAIPVLLVCAWMLLPACGSNTEPSPQLQAPNLAASDTTANTNNAESKAEDDDDEQEEKGSMVSKGNQPATGTIINNLQTAYAGEITASAKYAAFAKKAQDEGLVQIALLFKATSNSEKIHANNHQSVIEEMGGTVPAIVPTYTVRTTQENLAEAIKGESYEIATMYPEFLRKANATDDQLALTTLNYAYRTEQRHKSLYEKALTALQGNQLEVLSVQYFVCPTCGNTYDTVPPSRCRVSMTKSERFVKISTV